MTPGPVTVPVMVMSTLAGRRPRGEPVVVPVPAGTAIYPEARPSWTAAPRRTRTHLVDRRCLGRTTDPVLAGGARTTEEER